MLDFALELRKSVFSLQVEARFTSEWTVIFGPSGAGKSTLLRLLAGLDQPDRGRIALDDHLLTDTASHLHVKPGARRLGFVAQHPALFPHLGITANVRYGIRGLNAAQAASRVEEALSLVGAIDLLNRRPRDLSGGEAQRVALARALAPLPRLLLLDEPFSALDGAASDALLLRLRPWLRAHGIQAVQVTHDATDAYTADAEVALLRAGRIVAQGPAPIALAEERVRILQRLSPS
ncbi:MAG TPA: ATP-binding cassette domain-containing protein [Terracidiphilus sp.]|nr:ATP-binding cassette domain-containing protein [Terracidiphilus sp.]